MSEENVELVREVWKVFNDQGFEATLDGLAEDYVCEDVPDLPDHATYKGKEGARERYRHFREMWADWTWEPEEFIDAGGEVVVAMVVMRAQGKGSGAPIELQGAFVYEIRDGKIVRDRAFTSRSDALEAAGLSE
jgi:ketosteroid isomerase-like protein